jgi:hypothetical protein
MKIRYIHILIIVLVAGLSHSCLEEMPRYLEFEDYVFSSLDESGGSWKGFLVENPGAIEIPVPFLEGTAALAEEIQQIRQAQATADKSMTERTKYWSSNPILRWNEIALELAAKYNLIPGPNSDGTYTLPNPANPNGPPAFPFAHPPYTSRMLAYLSVAQYDGLITAWHYKFLYRRQAPYQMDPAINSAYAQNNLPSYPSDGSVVAAVSKKILTAMFPLEAEYLDKLYREQLDALVISGHNFPSDIEAGLVIGNSIATMALQRASTDGMAKAQTSKAVADSIQKAAEERFGWAWQNMESPKRLVGLVPLFGKVRMWNVPSVEQVRPGPPPAIGSAEFNADVEELKKYAKKLTPEQRKIANWWQDGLSTYTPPGHWNKFAKEAIERAKLNPLRAAKVLAYMNTAIMDAGISCWDTKYYYYYPRPIQTIPGFKTILGTPNFPAYTSGHSTFSAAGSAVLGYFFPAEAAMFSKYAREAADSRVYGGIHYRFDAEVGLAQGTEVGAYAINRAKSDNSQ